jgi:hypothetical protein
METSLTRAKRRCIFVIYDTACSTVTTLLLFPYTICAWFRGAVPQLGTPSFLCCPALQAWGEAGGQRIEVSRPPGS